MALSIVTFVPEGIVIACDGLAEIRNKKNDQGFLHNRQKRLFSFQDRFLICIHGDGYIKGLPYAFYSDKIFNSLQDKQFLYVKEFANCFSAELSNYIESGDKLSFYVAGIEKNECGDNIPVAILYDEKKLKIINQGYDNRIVYNYHAIGHSLWLNKLLLPTFFMDNTGEKVEFESVEIDFSKYSIEDAIAFSKSLLTLSREMDSFVQLKQMIGNNLYLGILQNDSTIKLTSL